MDSSAIVLILSLILGAVVVAYLVAKALRRRSGGTGMRPSLELTAQEGWSLLNLVLANHEESKVWVERAAFVFTDLDAEMQGVHPTGHGAVEIREFIRSHEALRTSLIEAVYNAAGKPQGAYAFRFLGAVRYRIDDKWIEVETPAYQVDMVRLSGTRLRAVAAGKETKPEIAGAISPRTLLGATAKPIATAGLETQTVASQDLKSTVHSI
jgi:hypothetical protein